MMKHFLNGCLVAIGLPLIAGCAVKTGPIFLEDLTQSEVSEKIVKGSTTKGEVRASLGDPTFIQHRRTDGKEEWIYSWQRREILPEAFRSSGTFNRLRILFDKKDVVENYSFSSNFGRDRPVTFS